MSADAITTPEDLQADRVRDARSAIADLLLLLDQLGLCEAAVYLSMAADRLELAASDLVADRAKLGVEGGAVGDQSDLAFMEASRQLEGPEP